MKILVSDCRRGEPAGGLDRPSRIRRRDKVFLLNAVSPTESSEAHMAITGMRRAGVKHVPYLSVHDADKAAWLPHFGAKVGIEEGLKAFGIPNTILRPNNFYQNDYWVKDVILPYGVYPAAARRRRRLAGGCTRHRGAAAIALTTPGHEGHTYNLIGPEAMTGTNTAAAWSRVLGRPFNYAGDDLDAWEKQSLQYRPTGWCSISG